MVGNRVRVKVAKNKIAPPFKTAEFDIMFGEGISREGDILDLGVNLNFVQKSGAWFSYGDTRLGQGRENSKMYLKENKDVFDKIEAQIKGHYGFEVTASEEDETKTEDK